MKNFHISAILRSSLDLFSFMSLITIYGIYRIVGKISRKFAPSRRTLPLTGIYQILVQKLDKERVGSISRVNLIELSLRNMADKKTRTWITMGGMAIGIGLIVLLVSIGYGLEQLVISRVARLEELKQADIVPGLSEDLLLTDKSVAMFKQIPGVVEAMPVISAVGKVNYNNSETDMAVYGVTSAYLNESAIRPQYGKIFENNETTTQTSTAEDRANSIAETVTDQDEEREIKYTLQQGNWYRVRENPDPKSAIIGYTRRIEPDTKGFEVTGEDYIIDDQTKNKWIKASVPLWEKSECDGQESCEDGNYLPKLDGNAQVKVEGFIAEISVSVTNLQASKNDSVPVVLGETTDGSLPIVEIATLSGKKTEENVQTLRVGGSSSKEMVVNLSVLKVLGLDPTQAVGSQLKIAFVIVGAGNEKTSIKTESMETEYTIIGVINEESTPIIYVPFIDLRSLGVTNYSQVKLVAENKDQLSQVRTTVESTGFGTVSVTDTIGQIDKLFSTLRTFLAALGIVALSVAGLGMFNTLTVSLLERTHEVGLMKAIGMKSSEVKELFMTESMIMGFFGGILGLILGIFAGIVLSIILSLLAITKGVGFLNITYVPLPFALLIIFVSLLVGVGTGYVPARRATRISALDALRYE